MDNQKSVQKVCVAGIGGFASAHHKALLELERGGILRVNATCDPRAEGLLDIQREFDFSGRGVSVVNDFYHMLDSVKSDWVSIATPIALHAPMHRACVEQMRPCYLEKPPTLDPLELERMIEIDRMAARKTQVGFYYTYEPERLLLKKRLLRGEFGRLRRLGLRAAGRRTEDYYGRSPWAGRLLMGETLVMDSCLGNAMAHHVHNLLFFAGGERVNVWGECHAVEARLFRANPIEGADTMFLRCGLENEVEFRIALTHACNESYNVEESLVCDKATIRINPRSHILISHQDGRNECISISQSDNLINNFRTFDNYVRDETSDIMGTLLDCRSFVLLNALSYVSARRITHVDAMHCEFVRPAEGSAFWRIIGIERMLERFVETGCFSSLQDLCSDSSAPINAQVKDMIRLRDVVGALCLDHQSFVNG